MEEGTSENHAVAAWLAGEMDLAQQLEFETHLAGCAQCQAAVAAGRVQARQRPAPAPPIKAEVVPPVAGGARHPVLLILAAALVLLIAGFGLGWWIWQAAHR